MSDFKQFPVQTHDRWFYRYNGKDSTFKAAHPQYILMSISKTAELISRKARPTQAPVGI